MAIKIDALILAGGLGERMGRCEKGLISTCENKKLLDYVYESLCHQSIKFNQIWLNINRNFDLYQDFIIKNNIKSLKDLRPNTPTPLAGIETGLFHSDADYLLIVPCDMPYFPIDLTAKLYQSLNQNPQNLMARFNLNGNREPLLCLCHKNSISSIQCYLNQNKKKVQEWQNENACIDVNYQKNIPNLINLNSINELKQFENNLLNNAK